jgi:hypothetical protein
LIYKGCQYILMYDRIKNVGSCVQAQTALKIIILFLRSLGMYYIIIYIRLNVVPNTKIPILQIGL